MKTIASFAIFLIATVSNVQPSSAAMTWFNCAGSTPTQMSVSQFTASPIPICANKPLQLVASGSLTAPIVEGALVRFTGRWAKHVVYQQNYDLCQILAEAGTPCPTAANLDTLAINIHTRANYPTQIPTNITIQAVNGDGNLLFCQAANQVPGVSCDPPTTTTPRPVPTPVVGDWITCDGPQVLALSSFSASPKAWCEGMNVCFNFAGTLIKEITSGLYMTLSTGYTKPTNLNNVFGSWSVDLQNQGFPSQIPAGTVSFKFCGPLNNIIPDIATPWRLSLTYRPDLSATRADLLCLKSTNSFEIPSCP